MNQNLKRTQSALPLDHRELVDILVAEAEDADTTIIRACITLMRDSRHVTGRSQAIDHEDAIAGEMNRRLAPPDTADIGAIAADRCIEIVDLLSEAA